MTQMIKIAARFATAAAVVLGLVAASAPEAAEAQGYGYRAPAAYMAQPAVARAVAYRPAARRMAPQQRRVTALAQPVRGARLTSPFGMRRHPISGDMRMHKGVDLAAPAGTPIYAVADGVVSFQGDKSGYGNFLEIDHNPTLQTAYAHLQGFAPGLREGARVRRGQIIGYVGSTGRSTGAHLHFETRMNGQAVDPFGFQSMRAAYASQR